MKFRKRGEHSHWKNDATIADKFEALSILNLERTTCHPHRLEIAEDKLGWEITLHWYRDSGYGHGGIDYYDVTAEVVEELKKDILVQREGALVNRLIISHKGQTVLQKYMEEMRAAALQLLKPGIHTDLTGIPQGGFPHRDGFRSGKLYFEFQCPNETTCRIFPETSTVLFPA